jgi:carbon monoxide dehydrogenase subunit G
MKITETIEVGRPVDKVWELFQDVPELATCLPGAELTEDKGDGKYAGAMSVKLGPMTANFEGEATVTSDAASRTGKVSGRGVDKRGGSQGQIKVDYSLEAMDSGGTRVVVEADVVMAGAAAQFGRTGLIQEISRRLIGEFVDCVEGKLAAATAEEAAEISAGDVKGMSLFFASLGSAIAKFFKRLFGGRKTDG